MLVNARNEPWEVLAICRLCVGGLCFILLVRLAVCHLDFTVAEMRKEQESNVLVRNGFMSEECKGRLVAATRVA